MKSRLTVPLARLALLGLLVGAALVAAPLAGADLADETALAEKYAPVVRIVAQAQECGYGEKYGPIDVDLLFDEPTVALRGPWNLSDLVKIGPAAGTHPVVYPAAGSHANKYTEALYLGSSAEAVSAATTPVHRIESSVRT